MSTVWRGLCLSHDPHIEFELLIDGREIHDAQTAVDSVRADPRGHPNCDVVVGGFSYPLIAAACACGLGKSQVIDITILRLVNESAKIRTAGPAESFHTAIAEWFRCNRCWTPEKLSRLLESER